MEILDILDASGEKTGTTATIAEAYEKGLIHRTVHVWLVNSKNQILLQKRSKHMIGHPLYWDISAAGHISAGDDSQGTALREFKEELGISIPPEDLIYLCTIREHMGIPGGNDVSNEFQDVYVVRRNIPLEDISHSMNEVAEVMWIDLEEFELWVEEGRQNLVPHTEEHRCLIKYLKAT